MPRPTLRYEQRRSERRFAADGDGQQRTRIAQAAARLVADHGITDWSAAKRKAARELGLPATAALPGDDEVEDALVSHHALFGGEAHAAQLRQQREQALTWMRRLEAFEPRLTGGVAAGWATRSSPIRLELAADSVKAVEIALLNAELRYRPVSSHDDGPVELAVDAPDGVLDLVVRTPEASRNRPRRDRHGREEMRLTAREVEALLEEVPVIPANAGMEP
jgi:hypothetical protein